MALMACGEWGEHGLERAFRSVPQATIPSVILPLVILAVATMLSISGCASNPVADAKEEYKNCVHLHDFLLPYMDQSLVSNLQLYAAMNPRMAEMALSDTEPYSAFDADHDMTQIAENICPNYISNAGGPSFEPINLKLEDAKDEEILALDMASLARNPQTQVFTLRQTIEMHEHGYTLPFGSGSYAANPSIVMEYMGKSATEDVAFSCASANVSYAFYLSVQQIDPDCSHLSWWFRAGVKSPSDIQKWMSLGVSSGSISAYQAANITLEAAQRWHDLGVSASDIDEYSKAGITLEDAEQLRKAGFNLTSPSEAQTIINFQKLGYSNKRISDLIAQGFTTGDIHDSWKFMGTNKNKSRFYLDTTRIYVLTDTLTGEKQVKATIRFTGEHPGDFDVGVNCHAEYLVFSVSPFIPVYVATLLPNNPDYEIDFNIFKNVCTMLLKREGAQ